MSLMDEGAAQRCSGMVDELIVRPSANLLKSEGLKLIETRLGDYIGIFKELDSPYSLPQQSQKSC